MLRDFGDKILPSLGLSKATAISQGANLALVQQVGNPNRLMKSSGDKKAKHQDAKQTPQRDDRYQAPSSSIDKYETSILSLLDKLEADYLTSKQLEMVMWLEGKDPVPVGIVDLDMSDYEPEEVRAKLAGGSYYVLGKIVGRTDAGGSLSLMQKATIWSVIDILSKVVATSEDQDAINKYRSGLSVAQAWIEKVFPLSIKGPAVRVAALSVCI